MIGLLITAVLIGCGWLMSRDRWLNLNLTSDEAPDRQEPWALDIDTGLCSGVTEPYAETPGGAG